MTDPVITCPSTRAPCSTPRDCRYACCYNQARWMPTPENLGVKTPAQAAYEAHMEPDIHPFFMRISTWEELPEASKLKWGKIANAAIEANRNLTKS